jgi:DNA-binding protein WhiA
MSFSTKTKDELARFEEKKTCCRLAETAALVRMSGVLHITSGRQYTINVTTENAPVARRLYHLVKKELDLPAGIVVRRKMRLKKNNSYLVRIYPRNTADLKRLGLLSDSGELQTGIAPTLTRKRCDKKSYLRGAFLAAGSVSNPEGDYHLEIISADLPLAEDIRALLLRFGFRAKISERKQMHVIYLKESDQITGFLALVGAHQALFAFENARILKEIRNNANRVTNCETANLDKMVDAAVRQAENIRYIAARVGFDYLPPSLREVASLRLAYPESSLAELSSMLVPPLGKSGVNHRLRRIDEIAEDLRRQA